MTPSLPELIVADDKLLIVKTDYAHAEATIALIHTNKPFLRQWLPWIDAMQTVDDFTNYITQTHRQWQQGTDYGFTIMASNKVAGRIGIHYIHKQNKHGAIGYWLGEEFSGRGIITKSCKALISQCFKSLALNRIEIKCGTGNNKSAAVPERLGFKKEGVLREAELVNGIFIDLSLYAILKTEWRQ